MATNARKGNDFLLKIASRMEDNVPSDYVTVAAMTTTSLTVNSASVDISNKDSGGWSVMLPGGGLKTIAMSAEGIFTDDHTHRLLLTIPVSKLQAQGYFEFTGNPIGEDTLVLNGVTWTFKSSGATGNQTNVKATLALTLEQLAADLNASVNSTINKATYSVDGDKLVIRHDALGTSGNSFTLGTGIGGKTRSNTTLTGGQKNDVHWNFSIVDGSGTWYGTFHIEAISLEGSSFEAQTWSVSLMSTGEIVYEDD